MFTGLILISAIVFIAVISYKKPSFEEKVIKNIPIVDWLNILVFPVVLYLGFILTTASIISRPRNNVLDFDDFQFLAVGTFFLIYAFVGMSIHFVSKVLSRYIVIKTMLRLYKINEVFHGKLSHYISFVSSFMLVFIIALFELNYPLEYRMSFFQNTAIVFFGVIVGLSIKRAIFITNDWFGGYNKPLFLMLLFMFVVLVLTINITGVEISLYPFGMFILSAMLMIILSFVVNQFFIISRLSQKKRVKFLMKILSG